MKVKELVEFVNNNKNKMLKPEQLVQVVAKQLETKRYIGIKQKKEMVGDIVDHCLMYEDGIFKFDDIEKFIYFTMKSIEAYTNIELSEDIEDDYDELCAAGLLEMVVGCFRKEYDDLGILLQMRCDYILNDNNIEVQLGKLLNNISDKIDTLVDSVADKVDGFNFSNLPIGSEDLTKLLDFIKK